jgi:RNase P subunit RPR2
MKTINEIIDEHPDVYRWKDETLDLCLYDKSISFISQINSSNCLRCGTSLVIGNEMRIAEISDNIRGVQLECNECATKYFLHQQVKFNTD